MADFLVLRLAKLLRPPSRMHAVSPAPMGTCVKVRRRRRRRRMMK
jgi:hypothetical protein